MTKPKKNGIIAVIGIGCIYPGAKSPLTLWENILSRRRQFREMPDVRLPNKDYYDPDPETLYKTYQNKAAVIDGYEFNWPEKRIPKQTFESTDIVHWLALDTALQALEDAGIDKNNISRENTGITPGNSLTGEFTRSNQMLLRWPYVRRALRKSAQQKGMGHVADALEDTMEQYYRSVFAPVTEDTLAGGLANTIAGRICNFMDLHGGGYIVDGACSSSLLAIVTAANYLELGQMDMVIAGGVDISLDTFELVGFAKTGALTPDEMRVYDKDGKGFLPGEGCGMVVLKRLDDAVRDKDQIYAVIEGWGISSDGKGGITAPSAAGQSRALIRAYKKANFDTSGLQFIEGHGTGTTVGDKVELEAISIALNHSKKIPRRNCGVTSLKSIIGHTKAAAGVGAFIKTVMSVNRRILPPTSGLKEPNPIFNDKGISLYPLLRGQIRDPESILYAGVSAMGFGGINSHVLLRSGDAPSEKLNSSLEERKLIVSNQSHELFLFAAPSAYELAEMLERATKDSQGISYAEVADFACYTNNRVDFSLPVRAAIVADVPFELTRKLQILTEKVRDLRQDEHIGLENNSIVAGYKKDNCIIGAVFPGQGSQKLNMSRNLVERNDDLKEILTVASEIFTREGASDIIDHMFRETEKATGKEELSSWLSDLKQTRIAQPAIILSSLLWYEYLLKMGIQIHFVSGHSLGELMAFYAAGKFDRETLLKFAVFRGKSMSENGSGSMASLQCSVAKAEELVAKTTGYITIANINSPEQIVVSGESRSIRQVVQMAKDNEIGAIELPVSAAFHSKLLDAVGKEILHYERLKSDSSVSSDVRLISSTLGKEISGSTALNAYFADQALNRVDFVSTVMTLSEHCEIILEVGPGKVLSNLISGINDKLKAFPVETGENDDYSLNVLLGNAFIRGSHLNVGELYKNRLVREFTPAHKRIFLINPLEKPFSENILQVAAHASGDHAFKNYLDVRGSFIREMIDADFKYFKATGASSSSDSHPDGPLNKEVKEAGSAVQPGSLRSLLYEKVAALTGFSASAFHGNMKLLDDFNLDSIKSGALINGISKNLNLTGKIKASELSNASLDEIVIRLDKASGNELSSIEADSELHNRIPEIIYELAVLKTGFPREAIKNEHKLLDDLNLDSIKAGAFISEILKKLNITKRPPATGMANASIGEIIRVVTGMIEKEMTDHNEVTRPQVTNWVNSYTVNLVEEPLVFDMTNVEKFWLNRSLVVVHDEHHAEIALNLRHHLKKSVPNVIIIQGKDLQQVELLESSCLLILVPDMNISADGMKDITAFLSSVCTRIPGINLLGFLQFNDGRFSRETIENEETHPNFSVVSFASSLHHEMNECTMRVIEMDRKLPVDLAVNHLLAEFAAGSRFEAAGYDHALIRRIMKYSLLSTKEAAQGDISFNETDVVVGTGGAKGITAACVFALAESSHCKTALVGTSGVNDEVSATLEKYSKNNLEARYYACDIANESAVKEMISKINQDLGEITVVVHGAGKNLPGKASQVNADQALDEISPKLKGAINLCNALSNNKLKFFGALTSIIGITGMPGNAWYAFSNENLDLYLRKEGKRRQFKTRTLAYSIWDEIGMGARMGSNKVLADMGIGSILPTHGADSFRFWLEHDSADQQVVIASRMGGLDTWKLTEPKMPGSSRFIINICNYEPGREIETRVKLSRLDDLYLDDHNYNDSLLFPTVFGLEAMAEAACLLSGTDNPKGITFNNLSLLKPIVVPHEGELEIAIRAVVMDDSENTGTVRMFCGVSTEDSDFKTNHFAGEISFQAGSVIIQDPAAAPMIPLNINPRVDLYTWLLFQGKKFQHIHKVYSLNHESVEFEARHHKEDPSQLCFSSQVRSGLILGSPLVRDVLLQSVQLFLTKKKYLPVAIRSWEIFCPGNRTETGIVRSRLKELSQDSGICDVDFVADGRVLERIVGYEVKALGDTPYFPAPEEIADLQQVYQNAMDREISLHGSLIANPIEFSIYKHHEEFRNLDDSQRLSIEEAVIRSMQLGEDRNTTDMDRKITRAANGKPYLENSELKISIAHSRTVLLTTAGRDDQGCDIEFVEERTRQEWDDLLENRFADVLKQLSQIDDDVNVSATRLWCVREALIKSFGMVPLNIGVEKVNGSGIVFKAMTGDKNNRMVLTFPVQALPGNIFIISSVISLKKENENHNKGAVAAPFFHDQGRFSFSFLTTFKDCKSFYGKTHFSNYPDWMGNLRELVLAPIGQLLLSDLESGEYGMVTNTSKIRILQEAGALNEISGNMWITDQSDLFNSFIDLHFDFTRKHPESGALQKIAECNLTTTWVKIEGRGIVKKSPIPEYFNNFLHEHIRPVRIENQTIRKEAYPSATDIGKPLYESKDAIRPQILMGEKEFHTGLTNGNTVGNLYYSNYYHWQAKVIEQYLFNLVPDVFKGNGKQGEFITLECEVKHLQEAMPFESIQVNMYIDKLYENGLKFYFEYFSLEHAGKRKLAYGSNTLIWCKRLNEKSDPVAQRIPAKISETVMMTTR